MDTVHFDVSPWWLVLLLSLDFQLTGINASTNPYENLDSLKLHRLNPNKHLLVRMFFFFFFFPSVL